MVLFNWSSSTDYQCLGTPSTARQLKIILAGTEFPTETLFVITQPQ